MQDYQQRYLDWTNKYEAWWWALCDSARTSPLALVQGPLNFMALSVSCSCAFHKWFLGLAWRAGTRFGTAAYWVLTATHMLVCCIGSIGSIYVLYASVAATIVASLTSGGLLAPTLWHNTTMHRIVASQLNYSEPPASALRFCSPDKLQWNYMLLEPVIAIRELAQLENALVSRVSHAVLGKWSSPQVVEFASAWSVACCHIIDRWADKTHRALGVAHLIEPLRPPPRPTVERPLTTSYPARQWNARAAA